MSAANKILYQRGNNGGDSDAWDDTLLIKAYDDAVSAMKAKLVAQNPEYAASNNSTGSKKKKKGKQKAKKKKSNLKAQKPKMTNYEWRVGDTCQAVFTEDGEIYSAQILSIDGEDNTCVVHYVDYGNQEVQNLDDLMPALSEQSSVDKTDTGSEIDSVSEGPVRDKTFNNRRPGHSAYSSKPNTLPQWGWNKFAFPMPPPPPPPPPQPSTASHGFPGYPHPSMFPGAGFGAPHSIFPGIPPPPPIFSKSGSEEENEALYSMLISWYMSGYHTGYYQGLRNAKSSSLFNGPHR